MMHSRRIKCILTLLIAMLALGACGGDGDDGSGRRVATDGSQAIHAREIVACAGDCNMGGTVTVDEIVKLVSIAQSGLGIRECALGDRDDDGTITVDEIIHALDNAIRGCPRSPLAGFAAVQRLAVGSRPAGVVAADFDGDLIVDIATTNRGSDDIAVRLGNGGGGFAKADFYPCDNSPGDMVATDVDGDAIVDLVSANGDFSNGANPSSLSVRLGFGNGRFGAERRTNLTQKPRSLLVGDFNGDALGDAVVVYAGSVVTMPGIGEGFFGTEAVLQDFRGYSPVALVADMNVDGHLDIVAAGGLDGFVFLGDGDGSFAQGRRFEIGRPPTALTVRDINSDSFPDLYAAYVGSGDTGVVSSFLGGSDAHLIWNSNRTICGAPVAIAVRDFNGDGTGDIVTAESSGTMTVVLTGRSGSAGRPVCYGIGPDPSGLVVADVNQDGRLDLLTTTQQDRVSVLFGVDDGRFATAALRTLGSFNAPRRVESADVDGNGAPDLIAAVNQSLTILLGDGAGFGPLASIELGAQVVSLLATDLGGSNAMDIVAGLASNHVVVLEGAGDGSFATQRRFTVGQAPNALAAGDFNHDGIKDIAVANQFEGTVSLLLGRSDLGFAPQARFQVGREPSAIAAVDVDADGNLDLLTANFGSGDLSVLKGNGEGAFPTTQRISLASTSGGPYALVVADLSGDGLLDIATSQPAAGEVSILLATAPGVYRPAHTLQVGPWPVAMAGADINQDGVLDLVTANRQSNPDTFLPIPGDVSVLLGRGAGSFAPELRFGSQTSSGIPAFQTGSHFTVALTVADLNLDGRLDIAVANEGDLSLTILYGTH